MDKISISLSTHKQHGQSLVEFGLMLMILMWLLAGAVDFGVAFFSYVAIRDAAEEGALYGSINPTGNIGARVIGSASTTPVDLSSTTVTVKTPSGDCPSDPLTVTVLYNYHTITPLISIITGPTITIQANATSVILKSLDPACH